MENYNKVKEYLLDLNYAISQEDPESQIFVINDESNGIKNLVICCADPILIMEQYMLDLNNPNTESLVKLLVKNRDIIHGAFALNEDGQKLIFRDTLQLSSLDKNELAGSINSLSLLISEFSDELVNISKN
ncbi:YbjN domain-containing protein [Flavobacteriales bacterium]|jgi:hypothetical protein|nr:YbjN domain-containing protein [Flavobacteriales bacterium]